MRARYPDQEEYVERGGVRTAYEIYGTGTPTVLFLPASGRARFPISPATTASSPSIREATANLDARWTRRHMPIQNMSRMRSP